MTEVTRILSRIEQGDSSAEEQLAAAKMAQEKPGQTLQATALLPKRCGGSWWLPVATLMAQRPAGHDSWDGIPGDR